MAISRSDRAKETSRIADLKEEFDSRETSTVKKKNSEIKRNQKKHEAELKETREAYENKISDMQNKFYDRLSERDVNHQKQIEDVRGVYTSQMRKKMEDSQGERDRLIDNYESEKSHQAKVTESQKELLQRKANDEIQVRNQKIDNLLQEGSANLQETLKERTDKMRASHEKDKGILVNSAQDDKQKAYNERAQLRRYYEAELGKEKRNSRTQNDNWSEKYSNTVQSMNSQYGEDLQVRDDVLKAEVDKNRNKFDQKFEKLEQHLSGNSDSFRNNMDEKVNGQLRSKDNEIYRLKNRMYVEQRNQKKLDGLEKQHIVDGYEEKLGIYEDNMNDQRAAFKDINDKRIDKLNASHSDILQEKTLRNRVEQSLTNEKHRQDRQAIIEQQKNDLYNIKAAAEKRVDMIQKLANDNEGQIVGYYDEYLDQLKEAYLGKVFEQREKHDKELANLTNLMGDKFRKLKQTYEQRLDRVTKTHEEKLARVNDEHAKEMKSVAKQSEMTISEKNKAIVNTRNEVEDKYENKIKTLQEQYQQQVDKLSDRHQEDLREMSVKIQNYSRKA